MNGYWILFEEIHENLIGGNKSIFILYIFVSMFFKENLIYNNLTRFVIQRY